MLKKLKNINFVQTVSFVRSISSSILKTFSKAMNWWNFNFICKLYASMHIITAYMEAVLQRYTIEYTAESYMDRLVTAALLHNCYGSFGSLLWFFHTSVNRKPSFCSPPVNILLRSFIRLASTLRAS